MKCWRTINTSRNYSFALNRFFFSDNFHLYHFTQLSNWQVTSCTHLQTLFPWYIIYDQVLLFRSNSIDVRISKIKCLRNYNIHIKFLILVTYIRTSAYKTCTSLLQRQSKGILYATAAKYDKSSINKVFTGPNDYSELYKWRVINSVQVRITLVWLINFMYMYTTRVHT